MRTVQIKGRICPKGRIALTGFFLLLGLFFSLTAWSQVLNDNFASAESLVDPSGTVTGSNEGATSEFGEPDHVGLSYGANGASSIWYEWTAPVNSFATFDTVGSDFYTLLAVYTGDALNNLTEVASNAGINSGSMASQVTFTCVAGAKYKIVVAGYSGFSGNVVLNWRVSDPLSPGSFQFTKTTYRANAWETTNTSGANLPGASITVTRVGGSAGRVLVDYLVTHDSVISTNEVIDITLTNLVDVPDPEDPALVRTDLYFTLMQLVGVTNFNLTVGVSLSNTLVTNIATNVSFLAGCARSDVFLNQFTNGYCTNFTGGLMISALSSQPESWGTNVMEVPEGFIIFGSNGESNLYEITTPVCSYSGVITNYAGEPLPWEECFGFSYGFSTTNHTADPFVDYVPDGNTLTFDDFQMSSRFTVTLMPRFDYLFITNNYYDTNTFIITNLSGVRLVLHNPRFDVSPAGLMEDIASPPMLTAGKETARLVVARGDSGFNFRKAVNRIGEGGTARIEVQRSRPFGEAVSVRYRFNYHGPSQTQYRLNTFELQSGSDYARPFLDGGTPSNSPIDFEDDPRYSEERVIRWAATDPNNKFIEIPTLDDGEVEFNEDVQIQFYKLVGETDGFIGQQSSTTLTILNNDIPAGGVDTGHNPDGSIAPNVPQPGANMDVYAVAVQSDDKTIIGGEFTSFNGTRRDRIARLLTNGRLDTTFNPGTGFDGFVSCLAVQTDGLIIAGGGFNSYNSTARRGIVRILANGSVDANFRPGTGVEGVVWATAIAPDGKIFIAGDFYAVNGTNRNNIARLNTDGSLDTTFDPGAGPDGPVTALTVQTNGYVVIGGRFTGVNGVVRYSIARLDASGALDFEFDPGVGADGAVNAVKVQADGKIVVGGDFQTFDFQDRRSVARLNPNGSVDLNFDPGTGADAPVNSVLVQSDGRIIIAGLFTSVNSTRRVGIARLLAHGPVDTSFMDTAYNQFAGVPNQFHNPLINPRNLIFSTAMESTGNIIIGGSFQRVGGGAARDSLRPRSNVARLIGGVTPGPGNIEFVQDSYSGDGNNQNLYITLSRNHGSLGEAAVVFSTEALPAGPGAGEEGVDFEATHSNPKWVTTWNKPPAINTRMKSDCIYGPNNGTLTVIPGLDYGTSSDDVYVRLLDRGVVHGDVGALLRLSSPVTTDVFELGGEFMPVGPALGKSVAHLNILDRNSLPGTLSLGAPNFVVNENGVNAVVNVTRTGGTAGQVSIQYRTANGTALAGPGLDYTAKTGTLFFNFPSVTNQTILIPINNDSATEPDEIFQVEIFNPTGGASVGLASATVTIVDNDFAPGRIKFLTDLESGKFNVNEDAGQATITAIRTGGSAGIVTVQFATSNLTATAGLDYSATNGVLTWNSGDTAPKTFTVPISDDGLIEGDETVNLRLTNPLWNGSPTPGVLTNSSITNAILTIVENDAFGFVQFNSANYRVNENGYSATITVVRSGGSAQTVSANYLVTNGTALAGTHFTATSGTLIFGPGEISKSFDVLIRDRELEPVDGDPFRTVSLQLTGANPGTQLGAITNAILTIADDEILNEIPGSLDTSYSSVAGANNFIYSAALQTDGRLVVGGDFTQVNNLTRNRIARLNEDGSFDGTFSSATLGANSTVRVVVSQTDDRVLIGGAFTVVNGTNRNYIARLNYNGTLDASFNPGAGADNAIYAIVESFLNGTNRVVYAGGQFTGFNGVSRSGIVRLTDGGAVDATFNPGAGVAGAVYAIAVQGDGKVVIGGDFTAVNGVPRNRIARLNVDGTLDATFNPAGANDTVRTIAIQYDGRILIGGLFTSVNGVSLNHIARLNVNGSLDTNFTPGVGANSSVYTIALQLDGRILLGGEFTQASGVTRNRITRLNANGTVDPMINFGLGANSFVSTLALQPDGKIILAGGFTQYDGVARPYLARIYGGAIDGVGRVQFSTFDYQVNENITNALITLRRIEGTKGVPATGNIQIQFATSNLTAEAGLDYATVTTNIVFPTGETVRTITVPIINDSLIESNEALQMSINVEDELAELGNQSTATITIVSDDGAFSFSDTTYRAQENALDGVVVVTILRTGSAIGAASVELVTVTNGTATAGFDYGVVTNVITFASGETMRTAGIPIFDDLAIEGDETFEVRLQNANGALLLSPTTATLTIAENDRGPGMIGFAVTNISMLENVGSIAVTLVRTNGTFGSVSVDYSTANGTAIAGIDYVPVSDTLAFADGETNKTFFIPVNNDLLVQGNRSFSVVLSNPTGGSSLFNTNLPITILDDEISLRFSTPAYIVTEGNSLNVNVFRESGTNSTITVNYQTVLGTNALPDVDYEPVSGTLTFTPGETVKSFSVTTFEDGLVEGDESFQVLLLNPSGGAQILPPTNAAVTIVDNDSAFEFSSESYTVAENGTNVVVSVIRTNASTGTISVRFATTLAEGNAATAGSDYISTNGILTFLDGESIKTFTVPILNDSTVEGDEFIGLTLSNPTNGTQLGTLSNAFVIITDDDAGVAFGHSTYAISENGVSLTVEVNRSTYTNSIVSVDYSTIDGTAVVGSDYQAAAGTLIFGLGETNKSFTVTVIDDTVEEGNESLLLKLTNPTSNASLVSPSAATLTIVDNDGSTIQPAGTHLLSENGAANGVIDTNETVTMLFALRNAGLTNTVNLIATLLSTNGVTSPSVPRVYGVLVTNGPSSSQPFTFTASGTNGARITAILNLQDVIAPGVTNNLGRVSFSFVLGTSVTRLTNGTPIILNDNTNASPYPSTINVSGLNGTITKVTATLTNVNHSYPDDIDILLVGPGGQQRVMLMSDAGSRDATVNSPNPLNFVTLTFDDAASTLLPDAAQIVTGTYRPTDFEATDILTNPAPVRPYGNNLGVFTNANPNGTWSLFAQDDSAFDSGSILGGWELTITAAAPLAPVCDLSLTVSATNQIVLSNTFTYTIIVTNHGPSPATSVFVTNTLPAGSSFVSATGSHTVNSNKVVFNIGALAKDARSIVTITVRADVIGVLSNSAFTSAAQQDPNLANNIAEVLTGVVPPAADLGVSVIGVPNPIPVRGGTLTYTIVVTNAGPATANNVMLTNTLPLGMNGLVISPTGSLAGNVVTCNLGSIPSHGSVMLTIAGVPTLVGTYTNLTRVGSGIFDPLKGNNTASVKTIVEMPQILTTRIGNTLTISWPAAATGYVLQSTTNLTTNTIWIDVTNPPPALIGDQRSFSTNISDRPKLFFRLKQ